MDFSDIIFSELKKIFEGVGDKYLEKRYNIPNTTSDFEKYYQKYLLTKNKYPEDGEFVGTIRDASGNPISDVFVNPKSLNHFDSNVRATSDIDGNLFVAKLDAEFLHSDLAKAVNQNSKYHLSEDYYYKPNITWYRIKNSNVFALNTGYDLPKDYQNDPIILKAITNVRNKNPQYKFVLKLHFLDGLFLP